jgi:hypothetical protein
MVKVMRGQVVVREITEAHSLWMPDEAPRQVKTHRGVVLALGEPARTPVTWDGKGGHEVPFGFAVGDVVQYHFEHHQEAWTMTWPADGKPATWLAQHNVDAVLE